MPPRTSRQDGRAATAPGSRSQAAVGFELPSSVAAAVSNAERAVDALNRDAPRLASLEVLARRLLRAESVASSRIEGLVLSQRRLAQAEAEEPVARDETARSVLGNVLAMEHAVALGARAKPLRLKDVLEIHRHLMLATTTPEIAGKLRDRQNWIGGNAFNPGRADFVPPAPGRVKHLMDDLVAFMNRTDLPPVVQAATPTPSSRPSTPSRTATVASGAPSSTSCCAGAASPRATSRR